MLTVNFLVTHVRETGPRHSQFPFVKSSISFVVRLVTRLSLSVTRSLCSFLFTVSQDPGACDRGRAEGAGSSVDAFSTLPRKNGS